jgi:5-methylcytosine-specific restriction endonuclease McrA
MSELRSAVEPYVSQALASLSDAAVEEGFAELQRAAEQIELQRLRWLADLDRRRAFERDGFLSTTAWLITRHRLGPGAAQEQVRTARALQQMPVTRSAAEAGDIPVSAVRLLPAAREVSPEAFARDEAMLIEAASIHGVRDLARVTAHWKRLAEPDGQDRLWERRRLFASQTLGGMVRIDGDLDPETGDVVLTALGAVMDADAKNRTDEDERTPAQRRADALGVVCRVWLDRADRPRLGGERPHVTVTVDLAALTDLKGAGGLDHGGAIDAHAVRRLACDASVTRVVLGPRSEPLDVGRRTPVIPPAIRRAVILRDGHCRFPGCDQPPSRCDVHHIRHWADGGPTSVANAALLCRRHHGLVHGPDGFRLQLENDGPTFRRPDGSLLEDRAPP